MTRQVAVVGAGIAGMGCAWALHRAGLAPTLFERRQELGGNAKTRTWQTAQGPVTTGLSVLAWPACYFHNYTRLLAELGVETEPTQRLRFFVKDGASSYAHAEGPAPEGGDAEDLARWRRLVAVVRATNARLAGRNHGEPASLYEVAPHNPFNLIPLKLLTRIYGISRTFWERVFVPIHSSSFLTVELDDLPAVIAPALEDIVSIAEGGALITWSDSSREVFARMAAGFSQRVHADAEVKRVERHAHGVEVHSADGKVQRFDDVVFACSAHQALALLVSPTRVERMLLGGVQYGDETDQTFARGEIHSDATVIPEPIRARVLAGYANYVERFVEQGRARYENTFVLSSWVPAARRHAERAQQAGAPAHPAMLVTYNRRAPIAAEPAWVDNYRAHPRLNRANLMRAMALRALQGKRRTYYCGSFTTPGNGHDLSLLSGFVVAAELGAPHPFDAHELARRDFQHLQRFMLGRVSQRPQAASAPAHPAAV